MGIATNDAELLAMISADVEKAWNLLGDDMQQQLMTEISSVGVPIRGGGIGDAQGVYPKTVIGGTSPEVQIEYDQGALSPSENSMSDFPWTHSSPIGASFGNFLELINEGLGGHMPMFGGASNPTTMARPFWTNFEMTMGTRYGTMAYDCMVSVGMPMM